MAGYYQCSALIIKTMPYRESDELVTVLTLDRGKQKALARGVKKVRSALRAPLQPFCHSQLYLVQGKELDTITQATMVDFYPALRDNFKLSLAAMYVMELLDKGLPDHEPVPEIFHLTVTVLSQLASATAADLWLRYFELKLLAHLGYTPELYQCTRCQKSQSLNIFSPATGGMLCSACNQAVMTAGSQPLSGEALGIMRLLLTGETQVFHRLKISPSAAHEIERAIDVYWHYHIEQPLPMKSIYQRYPAE